jgi:hypothetical protein
MAGYAASAQTGEDVSSLPGTAALALRLIFATAPAPGAPLQVPDRRISLKSQE